MAIREPIDLTVNGIDEVEGKSFFLNGCEYVFHGLCDEGGETFIFPLENVETGFPLFVAKILKYKPGAPEYRKRKASACKGFALGLAGVPIADDEFYELPGALMRFQLHMDGAYSGRGYTRAPARQPVTAPSLSALFAWSERVERERGAEIAIPILQQVLCLNPKH